SFSKKSNASCPLFATSNVIWGKLPKILRITIWFSLLSSTTSTCKGVALFSVWASIGMSVLLETSCNGKSIKMSVPFWGSLSKTMVPLKSSTKCFTIVKPKPVSEMNDFLIDTFQITKNEAEIFSSSFKMKKYSRNEKFIKFGKVCNEIGFLEKGLLKCVLIRDDLEIIDDFVFENRFVTNYFSFLTDTKSSKDIICIEDSLIQVINREQLYKLSLRHPFIETIARKVTEKLFISTHQRLEALRLQTAEERYLELLKSNKQIMGRVPQYEIASYLNVTPESVSRIRKNIKIRS